jgi:hypothetical protein
MPFEHDFYTVNRENNGLVWLCNKGTPSGKGKRCNDGVWWCRVYTSALKVLCMKIVNILIHRYIKPNDA